MIYNVSTAKLRPIQETSTKIDSADGCQWLPDRRGKFSKNPDPTPWKENFIPVVGSCVFFFFASVEILLDILADNTKKKASSMGTEFSRQFDRCSSGLAHPTSGSPDTHFQRSSSHGWGGEMTERNPLKIPSWELTYPPKKCTFENDFPFPQVGYVSSLFTRVPL